MKKNYMNLILIAVVSLFITTACSKDVEGEQAPLAVSFKTLVANGSATATTSMLTLTFDKAIEGLTADNLAFSAGTTGATKGALTAKGQGVYELAVSGITAAGKVSVAVAKAGHTFSPETLQADVFYVAPVVITNKELIALIETATSKTFTKNADGNVEVTANQTVIDGITTLDISFKKPASLEGIEYFTKLTELKCSGNDLTALDVSKNTALTVLECSMNKLTTLDVSKNTALVKLQCFINELTALDVTKNTALTALECKNNKLTALDVTKNTALIELNCDTNELTALDVSKNTALTRLTCTRNKLTVLDVSKNTALVRFSCHINSLTTLDITTLSAIDWGYSEFGAQAPDLTLTLSLTAAQKSALPSHWISSEANRRLLLQVAQ